MLIGTDDKIDKSLPDGIISIHRTRDQKELVSIYSSVDVLVNPTLEDNFPTVNLEALACGTPVITYNTGGSGEMIDEKCGIIVEKNDYSKLLSSIRNLCETGYIKRENCRLKSLNFNQDTIFENYIDLYFKTCDSTNQL